VGSWIKRSTDKWLPETVNQRKTKQVIDASLNPVDEVKGVVFIRIVCPYCGSKKIKKYGRTDRIYYCQCKECNKKFKALEKL